MSPTSALSVPAPVGAPPSCSAGAGAGRRRLPRRGLWPVPAGNSREHQSGHEKLMSAHQEHPFIAGHICLTRRALSGGFPGKLEHERAANLPRRLEHLVHVAPGGVVGRTMPTGAVASAVPCQRYASAPFQPVSRDCGGMIGRGELLRTDASGIAGRTSGIPEAPESSVVPNGGRWMPGVCWFKPGAAPASPGAYWTIGSGVPDELVLCCADRDPNQHFRALAGPRVDADVTLHEPHAFMNAAQP